MAATGQAFFHLRYLCLRFESRHCIFWFLTYHAIPVTFLLSSCLIVCGRAHVPDQWSDRLRVILAVGVVVGATANVAALKARLLAKQLI